MTEFANKSFSVYPGKDGGQTYRDNWDRVFGKNESCTDEGGLRFCFDEEAPDTLREPEADTCDRFMSCGCGWYTNGGCICYTRR